LILVPYTTLFRSCSILPFCILPTHYECVALPAELHRLRFEGTAEARNSSGLRVRVERNVDPIRPRLSVLLRCHAPHADHDVDADLLGPFRERRIERELHAFERDIHQLPGLDIEEMMMRLDRRVVEEPARIDLHGPQ